MSSIIYKSPVLLAFKIILLEILIELLYLTIGVFAQFVADQLGNNDLRFISPITQVMLLPLQLGVLIYMLSRWSSETFEIQEQELIVRQGLVNRTEKAYPYNNMQSVVVRQSLFERIANAGTVSVFVPTLGSELVFSEIPNPHKFAEDIKKVLPYPSKGQFIVRK